MGVVVGSDEWKLEAWFEPAVLDSETTCDVLDVLATGGYEVEHFSDVEPVVTRYSRDNVGALFASRPYSPDQPCKTFLGRGRQFFVSTRHCQPNPFTGSTSGISVVSTRGTASEGEDLLAVAVDLFERGSVAYAFVDRTNEVQRQHHRGTINDRLPGVFWANLLSDLYVNAIGRQRLLRAPWATVQEHDNGLELRLFDDPAQRTYAFAERIDATKAAIGSDRFEPRRWQDRPLLGRGDE